MSGVYKHRFAIDRMQREIHPANKKVKPDVREELLNDLRMLEHDVYDYKQVKLIGCDQVTPMAAFITVEVKDEGIATTWVPKSNMRIDNNAGFWIKRWFYDKEIYTKF